MQLYQLPFPAHIHSISVERNGRYCHNLPSSVCTNSCITTHDFVSTNRMKFQVLIVKCLWIVAPCNDTAGTLMRFLDSSCGICSGQNSIGTGIFPSTPVLPCQYHSNTAPYLSITDTIKSWQLTSLLNETQSHRVWVYQSTRRHNPKGSECLHHYDHKTCYP